MKIRNDYVSNSSSSSFILAWNGDIKQTIEHIDDLTVSEKKYLLSLIEETGISDPKEIISHYIDFIWYDIRDEVIEQKFKNHGIIKAKNRNAIQNFTESDEYWDRFCITYARIIDDFVKKSESFEHVSLITVDDTDLLEYKLVKLPITIKYFV